MRSYKYCDEVLIIFSQFFPLMENWCRSIQLNRPFFNLDLRLLFSPSNSLFIPPNYWFVLWLRVPMNSILPFTSGHHIVRDSLHFFIVLRFLTFGMIRSYFKLFNFVWKRTEGHQVQIAIKTHEKLCVRNRFINQFSLQLRICSL